LKTSTLVKKLEGSSALALAGSCFRVSGEFCAYRMPAFNKKNKNISLFIYSAFV
jgi:hypothetical protein